ncbi:ABC transporter substrate-binding protein [Paenibacillus nanensis]|uniref:ABC transporter substrate-binding protein n=1 Tax=Paenibacillus nanensis TaxID=393251 RepID=A0A3A1VKV5_9BACL|nr:ABC transporter substrate-binding protein [Paenibacillus nanensis]RIX60276.1 ABC transporter substrate-binding protein [Paenibacillus nanensis]
MKKHSFVTLISAICLVILLSACGNNVGNGGTNTQPSASPEASAAAEQNGAANNGQQGEAAPKFPRTIKAANGDITIAEQPKKVAVVHWGYGDSLLLFNLESVGIALPFTEAQSVLHSESYKPYVDKVKELEIVGENTTVHMEGLLAYGPDLIIAGSSVNGEIAEQLEKIATTVVIDEAVTDVWSNWQALVTEFGHILGQEEVAEKYIADYNAKVQEAKEKLADVKGSVAFLQVRDNAVWLQGANYLKPYYEGMGLQAPEGDAQGEGAELSLEGLVALNPDHLFLGYFNYEDKSLSALTDEWEKSEVWSQLKAVQNKQVYAINGQLALGYGPIGNIYGVNAVLEALE